MIKRIVKLTFKPELLPEFMQVFEASAPLIRQFPGCVHMELLENLAAPNILFTFSIWENESDLELYRQSELFKDTWAKTKVLFEAKAEAWSVTTIG